jgi:hypothetical protein
MQNHIPRRSVSEREKKVCIPNASSHCAQALRVSDRQSDAIELCFFAQTSLYDAMYKGEGRMVYYKIHSKRNITNERTNKRGQRFFVPNPLTLHGLRKRLFIQDCCCCKVSHRNVADRTGHHTREVVVTVVVDDVVVVVVGHIRQGAIILIRRR